MLSGSKIYSGSRIAVLPRRFMLWSLLKVGDALLLCPRLRSRERVVRGCLFIVSNSPFPIFLSPQITRLKGGSCSNNQGHGCRSPDGSSRFARSTIPARQKCPDVSFNQSAVRAQEFGPCVWSWHSVRFMWCTFRRYEGRRAVG